MSEQQALFSHPHDHFRLQHMSVVPNRCFVLMPFKKRFNKVYDTIVRALEGLMVCERADDLSIGKPVLERVLTGIRQAELIIADLTGNNANVFYELGLAHTQTKNILLLTQDVDKVPFDLQGFFCHTYSPNAIDGGLDRLATVVRNAAAEIRSSSVPEMLEGSKARTEQIVQYMKQLLNESHRDTQRIIRIRAGFSPLSNMGYPSSNNPELRKYGEYLEEEREYLIRLIEQGAILQVILHPHIGPWMNDTNGRWQQRLDRLLEFFNSWEELLDRCEFVISPQEGTNLIFFGEDILFEGHKTAIESGYGLTMVYTDKQYLSARLKMFDSLFQSAKSYTLETYGSDSKENQDALRHAVINMLTMAREGNIPSLWTREQQSTHTQISTQEAAELLNIYEPFLAGLLNDGQIPYRKIGNQYRVRVDDLIAYKQRNDQERRKALDALTEQAQELNMGY